MSKPLTCKRFLECLDIAKCEIGQVHRATTNGKTRTSLLNDMDVVRGMQFDGRTIRIYGVSMEIDESLPDNAIKMDGRMYVQRGG